MHGWHGLFLSAFSCLLLATLKRILTALIKLGLVFKFYMSVHPVFCAGQLSCDRNQEASQRAGILVWRVVGLHQILAGNGNYYMLGATTMNCQSSFKIWVVIISTLERCILLRLGCRDGLCIYLPSLLYHPYLVCIRFGMPSLHLSTLIT